MLAKEAVEPANHHSSQPMATETTPSLTHPDRFPRRHIGPSAEETSEMLQLLGYTSLEALAEQAVPKQIQLGRPLNLPHARTEAETLADLRQIAARNQVFRSYIGMGYSDCITPGVIQRNILENPGWYTQYTPYQAEISQGRLEALLMFQTMIIDLTAMDVANASLLDESTAAAEAMTMCHALKRGKTAFLVARECHPQTIDVVHTRAQALGIDVRVAPQAEFQIDDQVCGALVQYPDTFGSVEDFSTLSERLHMAGALLVVAADLLSLAVLRAPGEFGADIALGSAQRFGYLSGTVALTPLILPRATLINGKCPEGSWGCRKILAAGRLTGSLCKRASNIFAARKQRATSARRKRFWQTSRQCMPVTMGRKASGVSQNTFTVSR